MCRVQPSSLCGAGMLGVVVLGLSRQRVTQLSAKRDFPAAIATLSVGKIWAYADIKAWAETTGRTVRRIQSR